MKTTDSGEASAPPPTAGHDDVLTWIQRVPMVGDRFFLGDMLRWGLLTGVACTLIIGITFVVTGDPGTILLVVGFLWAIVAALVLGGYLVALVVFRNRYFVRYRIDEVGVHFAMARSTGDLLRGAAASTIALGALLVNPTAAGAGALAGAQQSLTMRWSEIVRVVAHPSAHVISLRNGWRTVFRVRTDDDESYRRVEARIHRGRQPD